MSAKHQPHPDPTPPAPVPPELNPQTANRPLRAAWLLADLRAYYPQVDCTLDFREDPWRLLVGAILAAQCTDARVNLVTPELFKRFPEPRDFAAALPRDIEPYIRSCGLYHNKARNIQAAAAWLQQHHRGRVPDSMPALLAIPGVGRKIACLILGDSYGRPAVVVDTHCARISQRMGLTDSSRPPVIERDLMNCLPQEAWIDWGHLLVTLGRDICVARRPDCPRCPCRTHCRTGRQRLGLPEPLPAARETPHE
ncbi:MAG: endonuclease III [Oscillospiraceae bacterium]|nr:endonuclease III [Oscillospiraceae bacterium]